MHLRSDLDLENLALFAGGWLLCTVTTSEDLTVAIALRGSNKFGLSDGEQAGVWRQTITGLDNNWRMFFLYPHNLFTRKK